MSQKPSPTHDLFFHLWQRCMVVCLQSHKSSPLGPAANNQAQGASFNQRVRAKRETLNHKRGMLRFGSVQLPFLFARRYAFEGALKYNVLSRPSCSTSMH